MKKSWQTGFATLSDVALSLFGPSAAAFIFTLFSLRLPRQEVGLAPLWFTTAVIMVAFWHHPGRRWPAIAAVCTLASLAASALQPDWSAQSLVYTAVNVTEAAAGAVLLRKLLPQEDPLQDIGDWLRLTTGGVLIPPLLGGALIWLFARGDKPLETLLVWMLSEATGALALIPPGLLLSARALRRHRAPRQLMETLATLAVTLALSGLAAFYLPWPFTCVVVLMMWSALRLPRLEAFAIFLATVMVAAMSVAQHPVALRSLRLYVLSDAAWLPFLLILLPAHIMTMVMHAFRTERQNISESEARFRNAMEYSAIGMALVGIEGQFLQVNKSLCRFLDYGADELRALTFQQLTLAEDLDTDIQQLELLLRGEINSYSLEKRYYTRQGRIVWALLAVSLVRHADGAPLYFIAQVEDINDLKEGQRINQRLMERITLANEAGGIGIWEWEPESNQVSWDKRMFELYDTVPDQRPSWQLWRTRLLEEDREPAERSVRVALRDRAPLQLEFRIRTKSGVRHIHSLAKCVLNPQGEVTRLLGVNMDITEVKRLNEALFQEKERLHITLDSIGEAVLCTDTAMNVTFMNPVAEKMSGWTQEQALGQPILRVMRITFGDGGPPLESIEQGARADISQDLLLRARNGDGYDIHYSMMPLSALGGRNTGFVLVIQDVTTSRKMLRQLSYSASHDALTQLANRASFENQLGSLLHDVREGRRRHVLAFLDLDRFKAVNDTAGHAAGDALLRELSSLMLSRLRAGDLLARLGGDEFALLLPDCDLDGARVVVGRLVDAINDYPFIWEHRRYRIGASAGITLIDENNDQPSEVMSQADIACYASKNRGRGRVTAYEAPQDRRRPAQPALPLAELRRVIDDGPLTLMAYSVASPRIPQTSTFWLLSPHADNVAGEALLRQQLELAPELALALDRRLWRDFFREWAAAIAAKGHSVSLPLSVVGLQNATFIDELTDLLAQSGLPGGQLHLALPATAMCDPQTMASPSRLKLRQAGCKIVLGVGRDLTLFGLLTARSADYLLLDADLIANVHLNLMDEMLVTIIQGHARRLGMKTIAGPTQQSAAMATLAGIGVDFIYGEAIAAPQPLRQALSASYFAIN